MLIGLGHRRGVGKNTIAELMKGHFERNGYGVGLVSFASKLKSIAYDLYAWGGLQTEAYYEKYYDEKEKMLPRLGKSPRTIWIEIGNKMRDVHPMTWIKAGLKRQADVTIIADARYPNELDAIKEDGGLVIKINNANVGKHDDVADSAAKDYKDWDYVFDNSGTRAQLEAYLEAFMSTLYGRMQDGTHA